MNGLPICWKVEYVLAVDRWFEAECSCIGIDTDGWYPKQRVEMIIWKNMMHIDCLWVEEVLFMDVSTVNCEWDRVGC